MKQLSNRERELVAIGAAMGSNCAACLAFHIPEARLAGLNDRQIEEAIELSDAVRLGRVRMDHTHIMQAASRSMAR